VKFLSALRRAPERLLHPWRRRKAIEGLLHRDRPAVVLVVCHGNICRSPFAGLVLQRLLAPHGMRAESAGFIGPGRSPPPEAIEAAEERAVDLSSHRSRLITPDVVGAAGLVVVMDAHQAREIRARFGRPAGDVVLLGDFDPKPIETRHVHDPVDQPLRVFSDVYDRIDRCLVALSEALIA
jgi:protein-tyrosine phosphatase